MKKSEFILVLLSNNMNVYTNPHALPQTVKDMIDVAEKVYDHAIEEIKSRKLDK